MVMDWNQYHKEIGARVGDLAKLSPDTVKGYQTLSAANSQTTKLGEKTRQLISLAVAVTTRCDGCIVFHTDAARPRRRRSQIPTRPRLAGGGHSSRGGSGKGAATGICKRAGLFRRLLDE